MTPALSFFGIIAMLLAVAGGVVVLVVGTVVLAKVGGTILTAIGAVLKRILEFIGGVFSDATRLVGAVIAAVVFVPLALGNVVIGRWSAANHYAEALRRELGIVTCKTVSILARRPMRLLFLEGMLEGVEQRAAEAVRQAPGADRPRRGMEFDGFEITGSLPAGGSGAKLYIARPDDATRRRLAGEPDEVVIKSFALAEGSSLPQIVRESRSLDAARRLGLVLAHELDDTRFWYAMPYHPGDNLSVVVRHAHGFAGDSGIEGHDLGRLLGYAIDLVGTLDRYHQGGMWHKDVKPDNIIVHDGAAHLVDFGLVSSLKSAMTLTTHGTEYFRDPEMVRMAMRGVKVHEVNGAKFDLYGAGAVLYFMLENTFPGHGGLSRFERRSPEALRMIVRRAMADYAHRYESAAEMLADLETVAAAADPWSVKPGMLPSMGGGFVETDEDVEPEFAASTTRRTPPPPPPIPAASGRPDIRVTSWWTGGYESVGGSRRRARQQVADARRRASVRRQAVATRPGSRVSVVLAMLVLGVITAVVGSIAVFLPLAPQFENELARTAHEWQIERALATGGDPSRVGESRAIVIDDQGPVDLESTIPFAEMFGDRLRERGWVLLDDADSQARARVLLDAGHERGVPRIVDALGVERVFLVRPVGEPSERRIEVVSAREGGSERFEVETTRFETVDGDGRPEAAARISWPDAARVVETRILREMARAEATTRVAERLRERAEHMHERFIELEIDPDTTRAPRTVDWTSDASATIVTPHGPVLHDN